MFLLLLIGFVAGVVTAVSPCVLPVLPIVLAGGAAGGGRRPYAIVAGLVASFTAFTLAAGSLLSALGLPQDTLRNVAIGLLFLVAATLLVPELGTLLERPFERLTRRRSGDLGGGFLLGASLGLVFVPCAGPVLATVTVLAAEHRIGVETVLLTLFYALGTGSVLLLIALGGQRVVGRLRVGGDVFRRVLGVAIAGAALAIVFNLDRDLQTSLGSYSGSLQKPVERTAYARAHLARLQGGGKRLAAETHGAQLPDYGPAPDFHAISYWLNTPGERPLSIAQLHGKVVLVDFWTYSCINCIRTLPHLRAWYAAYRKDGFEIVGVHTPEFAFEHVLANVRKATRDLRVTWPVALDNSYVTWDAYGNQYWPAEYLVDRSGHLRRAHFGEGEYDRSEQTIRKLLGVSAPATRVADETPTELVTPETYLGPERLDPQRYAGSHLVIGKQASYTLSARLPQNFISYGGSWALAGQTATAGADARLRLHFHARDVYIVLGGAGRVQELVDGRPVGSIDVSSYRLYTALASSQVRDAVLELRFPPGVRAYSFTFG